MSNLRLLEALAGIRPHLTHSDDESDCRTCVAWEELQSAALESVAEIEALRGQVTEYRQAIEVMLETKSRLEAARRILCDAGLAGWEHVSIVAMMKAINGWHQSRITRPVARKE